MKPIRLVNTKNISHDEWLEWRRKGIGGSDAAAICGMSRYRSAMAVYLDKLGDLPPLEDSPKMKAGRVMEPVVANWFSEDTGLKVKNQHAIFQHPKYLFMLANIDRQIVGQKAGLECKNTSEYCRDDWSGTQAPKEYILQCNHYMAVMGYERWYIAVLIGGWDLQWRVIERDEDLIRDLITIEQDFWEQVQQKVPPAYSFQDTELIKERFGESEPGKRVELPESAYDDMQGLYKARCVLKSAKEQEETYKNRLKGLMGDAEYAYFQEECRFTWKSNSKSRPFKVVGGEE